MHQSRILDRQKKNVDLKHEGTGNLGATNTALVLGKKAGYFVLIFDMIKSIFSYKMAKMLFARLPYAGLIAGIGVLLGHCFPVFMHFQGGKGLASFGGLVLAHDPLLFAILLMHSGNLKRAITGEGPIHVRDGLHRIWGERK